MVDKGTRDLPMNASDVEAMGMGMDAEGGVDEDGYGVVDAAESCPFVCVWLEEVRKHFR